MIERKTLSIAVISGKGGVGKTNITLNLGYALYRAKQRVLMMDCDLGLANLDVLLGITPKASIEQVFAGGIDLADIAVDLEPEGFSLLPAASGLDVFNSPSPLQASVLERINTYTATYDYCLLDVGAGITEAVQAFASKAMMRIVVITPEPTSITDAYALIKVLSSQHGVKDFYILVNQTESPGEEKSSYGRLAAACDKFLGITLASLGSIRSDATFLEAVRRQIPLLKLSPSTPAAKDLIATAVRIHRLHDSLETTQTAPLKTT